MIEGQSTKKVDPNYAANVLKSMGPQFGLDPVVFNELIVGHGIKLIHAKPLPCPNRRDIHASDHDPSCDYCHNGYLYYGHKELKGAIMSNSIARQFGMQGTYDIDQAAIMVPTVYVDGSPLDMQMFDQIMAPEEEVRYFQLVEHSQRGIDRLHFPATRVDRLIASNFDDFHQGRDFVLDKEGHIKWNPGKRPGNYDLNIRKGPIYAVNYFTSPIYTVISLPHQLRTTVSIEDGKPVEKRFPQLVMVRKDFVPYDARDTRGPSDSPEPADGQFNK